MPYATIRHTGAHSTTTSRYTGKTCMNMQRASPESEQTSSAYSTLLAFFHATASHAANTPFSRTSRTSLWHNRLRRSVVRASHFLSAKKALPHRRKGFSAPRKVLFRTSGDTVSRHRKARSAPFRRFFPSATAHLPLRKSPFRILRNTASGLPAFYFRISGCQNFLLPHCIFIHFSTPSYPAGNSHPSAPIPTPHRRNTARRLHSREKTRFP